MIVLDTNALSEALKPLPSEIVLRWLAAQEPSAVFITTITQAEVLYGVELLPAGQRRMRLSVAIDKPLRKTSRAGSSLSTRTPRGCLRRSSPIERRLTIRRNDSGNRPFS